MGGAMSSITINGDTSGSVILQAPAVSGSTTLTLPTTTGTLVTSNAMPTGSVVQVVNAIYNTYLETTSNSYVDTGLQAIITPASSSNKILIVCTAPVYKLTGQVSNGVSLDIVRNGSAIGLGTFLEYGAWTGASNNNRAGYSITYLDSPSSTSALTYKLRIRETFANVGVGIFHDGSQGSITLMEIKA